MSKKRLPQLHGIGEWSNGAAFNDPLLFVMDKSSGVRFLIDTGPSCSIFTLSYTHIASIQPSSTKTLSTIGGEIQITGSLKATFNLGLSRLLPFDFYVVHLAYGIIGADFLKRRRLCGDSRAATYLTVDTSSVNIASSVKSSDKVAMVHELGVKLGTHEAAK